jgi:sulfite exporter TauE/SafE
MMDMSEHLARLAALCGPDGPAGGASLFVALFLAGTVGSVVHCAAMCGPFVLAQVSGNLARVSAARLCERQRLMQGALLPYHAGRLVTYMALGAVAAGTGALVGARLALVPSLLLGLGALLFLSQALRQIWPALRLHPRWTMRLPLSRLTGRIDRNGPWGGFLLGVVLGFLPCGLLYAALSVAAGTADPMMGAMAMAGFALGTVPGLLVVGVAGQIGLRRFRRTASVAGPGVMLFNALMLTGLAWQRLLA